MSRFDTLSEWLNWLEQLHPKSIDLGLERVYAVAQRLNLLKQPTQYSHAYSGPLSSYPDVDTSVITVAGTNGKGSCIATLEKALMSVQVPEKNTAIVGSYTSPHLHHYCERIRIDGEPVSESLVCSAFAAIDEARGDISLTYFEFGTLAALWVFVQKRVAYALLEVGLGGRLDAVNIIDTDIAVVTSIDIDHQDCLGNDRNIISQEKLGIARTNAPLIITEKNLTESLKKASIKGNVFIVDRDFSFEIINQQQWRFEYPSGDMILPLPTLPLGSVAAALVVLNELKQLPAVEGLSSLMQTIALPGRFEAVDVSGVELIYDVAHNPAAAGTLAKRLTASPPKGKTYAVIAFMVDKEHEAILARMADVVDEWFLGGLPDIPRAATPLMIAEKLTYQLQMLKNENAKIICKSDIESAFDCAFAAADSHDRIIIFGSFYTVAAVQKYVVTKANDFASIELQ